jgi:hypothetical protein
MASTVTEKRIVVNDCVTSITVDDSGCPWSTARPTMSLFMSVNGPRLGWFGGSVVALSLAAGCGGGSPAGDGGRVDAADARGDTGGTGGKTATGGAGGGNGGMPGTGGLAGSAGAGGGGATGMGGTTSTGGRTVSGGTGGMGGNAASGGASGVGGTTPACGFVMPNAATSGLPNPASYDTSVAGIVTDRVTGLSWQRQVAGLPAFTGCSLNITGLLYCPLTYATAYCTANRLGGFSDWRLPTVLELISLVDTAQSYPSIDSVAFPETPYEGFWSSTRGPGLSRDYAWSVSFANAYNSRVFIDEAAHVRCVRTGAQPPPRCAPATGHYQVMGDLVVDAFTGLTWQRGGNPADTSPATAATYCTGLGTGFRVPTIKELLTLVNFTVYSSEGGVLDLTVFERPRGFMWSSTTFGFNSIWVLDVTSSGSGGTPSAAGPSYTNGYIKCVR